MVTIERIDDLISRLERLQESLSRPKVARPAPTGQLWRIVEPVAGMVIGPVSSRLVEANRPERVASLPAYLNAATVTVGGALANPLVAQSPEELIKQVYGTIAYFKKWVWPSYSSDRVRVEIQKMDTMNGTISWNGTTGEWLLNFWPRGKNPVDWLQTLCHELAHVVAGDVVKAAEPEPWVQPDGQISESAFAGIVRNRATDPAYAATERLMQAKEAAAEDWANAEVVKWVV